MQVHDEIAHVGVVDRLLRLGFPGDIRGCVVGKHADNLDLVEILEGVLREVDQFTTDDEMKQLLRGAVWHECLFLRMGPAEGWRWSTGVQGNGRSRKCETMLA